MLGIKPSDFGTMVLSHGHAEGLVERQGTLRRVGDEGIAGRIPEGLRDVVGKRLSRLSVSANQALSVASVIGREFQVEVLRRVLGQPDEQLEAALEEASSAHTACYRERGHSRLAQFTSSGLRRPDRARA